ncbi:unnamed protein product [Ixodes persulcatus]
MLSLGHSKRVINYCFCKTLILSLGEIIGKFEDMHLFI